MKLLTFENRAQASETLAGQIAHALQQQLERQPRATLVASGGNSPRQCYEWLSQTDLPWYRVNVTLSDERSVPVADQASNEGMLRSSLLTNNAANARFIALDKHVLADIYKPFACCLLGMGEDGHFASIFPDNINLASALALDNSEPCFSVTTAARRVPRVSMSLSQLIQSENIFLLAFGDRKRSIVESPQGYPVAALLQQQRSPVQVFWAP